MSKVKKAVIPVAGLGTRFLPATKTVPKELFPIIDRPILLYLIEECVAAGIEDIILVQGRGKTAIEDFFDRSYELESTLEKSGKTDWLQQLQAIRSMANIISIRQKEALGLGHAVLTAAPAVGNEPFAVLLGDELMVGGTLPTQELCDAYSKSGASTVSVMEVPASEVSKYGIVKVSHLPAGRFQIHDVVEKPATSAAPSNLALPGRYVFSPELFEFLKVTRPGKNGEIQLTDGMNGLARKGQLYAQLFKCRRYDAGDKFGYVQANLEMGLSHPEIGPKLREYVKQLARGL